MAHINVPEGIPGIRSLVMFRPETGQHLYALADVLLRGESPLTSAERELIASYVSSKNNCHFCMSSHAAAARELYGEERDVVDCVIENIAIAQISKKMKALLHLAEKVQQSGKNVSEDDINEARKHGAGDRDIHDTVLIAATFSMFNRYVDGLNSFTPTDKQTYETMGKRMTTIGYVLPKPEKN